MRKNMNILKYKELAKKQSYYFFVHLRGISDFCFARKKFGRWIWEGGFRIYKIYPVPRIKPGFRNLERVFVKTTHD